MKRNAIYVLTRGYSWKKKYKYVRIIFRNRAIKRLLGKTLSEFDMIIFHEGNINNFDQFLISMFSNSGELHFIDIGKEFVLPKGLRWSNTSDFSLGYSLMCRFQYYGIWKYIAQYKKVVRIDEDCIIKSLPSNIDEIFFATGKIEKETHMKTNETLKIKLKAMGMEKFYDHEFPYTNVFIADVPIWLSTPVQNFLATIASDSYCLENRWGDLPVLGVAAKAFDIWKTEPDVRMDIAYFHGSHSIRVNIK